MSYRKEDIPNIIQALKAAQVYIASGRSSQICNAITIAAQNLDIPWGSVAITKSVVMKALVFRSTLDEWFGYRFQPKRMRELRLKWIRKMIRDLKRYQKVQCG